MTDVPFEETAVTRCFPSGEKTTGGVSHVHGSRGPRSGMKLNVARWLGSAPVRSHTRTSPPSAAAANDFPSAVNAIVRIRPSIASSVTQCLRLVPAMRQRRTVRSTGPPLTALSHAVASSFPSVEKTTRATLSVWPSAHASGARSRADQSRTHRSDPPLATMLPSGLRLAA